MRAGLAPAARLLAGWWSRPTATELERWAGSWPAAYAVAEALELPADGVDLLRTAPQRWWRTTSSRSTSASSSGPGRAPCSPYESLWRDDVPRREQGRLMGILRRRRRPASTATSAFASRRGMHELPDHVVVEWEALAYALEQEAEAACAELVQTHLALWMAPFCAAVAGETEQPYYAALARLTPEWTAALAA